LTRFGEVYYEGKEFEVRIEHQRPGALSDRLRRALAMESDRSPPPWLINMQRFGPPPSYPHLKIPGLNAPIPPGCTYGYGPGQWGKPPVDRTGMPLYGDPFGQYMDDSILEGPDLVDRSLWGAMEVVESSAMEEAAEETEEELAVAERAAAEGATVVPSVQPSLAPRTGAMPLEPTPEGAESTVSALSGVETPQLFQVRKQLAGAESEEPAAAARPLYRVLEERKTSVSGSFGSTHRYEKASGGVGDVNVALNPEEISNLDAEALKSKFEKAQQEGDGQKRKTRFQDSGGQKYNDYKF
jgi:splicing factor 3B subunit 2